MDDIITRLCDLPEGVRGFTAIDCNGDYNIFLNSRLSQRRIEAYNHEMRHIYNSDFEKEDADQIEQEARKRREVIDRKE